MYNENAGRDFSSGYDFEVFCFGYNSLTNVGEEYLDEILLPEAYNFWSSFCSSVRCAVLRGHTQEDLRTHRAFFWRMFCEVRTKLPKTEQNKLRGIVLLRTSLDRIHGVDMVFLLGDRYVTIDVTTDHFKVGKMEKERENPPHFVFDSYQIGSKAMMWFAGRIAEGLRDGVGIVPYNIWPAIRKIMYQCNTS